MWFAQRRMMLAMFVWLAVLVTALALLGVIWRDPLEAPALRDPAAWPAWAQAREPLEVAFVLARLGALATAWYLLGATTIGLVARLARWGRLITVADLLTIPQVRRLLQAAFGLGLATAAVTATTIAAARGPVPAPVYLRSGDPSDRMLLWSVGEHELPNLTLPAQEPGAVPDTAASRQPRAPASEAAKSNARASDNSAATRSGAEYWQVAAGEHFWSIAQTVLSREGIEPDDRQVHAYWQRLIAANRSRLADPGNPDLLFPGQTLTLPPVDG